MDERKNEVCSQCGAIYALAVSISHEHDGTCCTCEQKFTKQECVITHNRTIKYSDKMIHKGSYKVR